MKKEKIIKKKNKRILYDILSIVLIMVFAFICLYKLGVSPIQNWDEARHGVNAYEMIKNHNYIVTTYGEEMDYWNLKPPLSEYFILLGYVMVGYNAWGLRLMSALAMIIACVVCYLFTSEKIGKRASLYLLVAFSSLTPILFFHGVRAGDADSLFVLFYTCAIISLVAYKDNFKGVYLACLCFSLAFLTKSWHAGLIAIIILEHFVLYRMINVKNIKNIVISFLIAILPIAFWFILRYFQDGILFFKNMIEYDLLRRSTEVLEEHEGGIFYYIHLIFEHKGSFIYLFLSLFAFLEKKQRKECIFIASAVCLPVILFSIVRTKLLWYIYCIYPSWILLSAYGTENIIQKISSKPGKIAITSILIASLMFFVFQNIQTVIQVKQGNNLPEIIFRMCSRDQEYAGKRVYISDWINGNDWNQNSFLAMELAGDMKPKSGGIQEWKKDKNSYLLIKNMRIR